VTNAVSLRRQRDLGEIVSDSFKVYNGGPYIPLLFVLALPTIALNALVLGVELATPPAIATLLTIPLTWILGALLGTGAIYALDQIDRGNVVRPGEAILEALARADHLIWSSLKSTVIAFLFCFTIVGIPWGIARFISWAFTSEAVMVDNQDGNAALEYSHDLVAGRGWPTAGLLIVTGLITGALNAIIFGLGFAVLDETLARAINVFPILTFPFGVMANLLIYYDLKMRKALA
jgi:hypothetical protein